MANNQIKEAILNSFKDELEIWLETESSFTNGYDYETAYAKFMHRVGQMVLQKSIGDLPRNRNSKKNSNRVLERLK